MHVLDLFNDKDRNFLNGGNMAEGGMPDLNLEYQDYLKLPPMAFQSRYKMSKEAWAEKYKNLLPKTAPVDPLAGMPEAPLEEGDVVQMPARTGTSTPQASPAEVIPMIKDRTDRAYAMWKQRVLQAFPDNAEQIKFYSKGNDVVARLPGANNNLGIFNIDSHKGTVLNEVDPNNFDSDWDYQDAVAKSGRPRSSYRSQEDDTSDADVAYSKKMYQLSQKQKRDADHDRLATGTNEGELRFDPLVAEIVAKMQGPTKDDAIAALITVLGTRAYAERPGFYSLWLRQAIDKYSKEGMAEGTDIDARISNLKDAIRFETPRSVPGEDHREQYARHAEKIAGYKAELKKLVAQKKQQGVAEADVEEGLGSKLAGLGLAGAMALGSAGANARVTPDGQGGYTGGLKPTPTVTQPATNTAPTRIDSPSGPGGFSKEYLQKAADPNRTGRYMISVEKAQQLLKQTQEAVAEGADDYAGTYSPEAIELGKKFCAHYNITKNDDIQFAIEQIDNYLELFKMKNIPVDLNVLKSKLAKDFRFVYRGMGQGPSFRKKFQEQGVAEADMSRRGFLKGVGAAALTGVGASSQAQSEWQQDLGNGFVTAKATIDGVTYRAIQDTISKSGYMLNQRSDGTPIVNRPGEFLVVRNGKIEARPSLAPNIIRALQKAGILSVDDSQVPAQTSPAVTHSSRGGTNQPAVTHSSRGGTNQPAVTYSSGSKRMRNEETTSRMKMDDYLKAAEDLQNRLTQAIRQGNKELIKKLSKDRDDLDARVRQHGMIPEVMHEGDMQSLVTSYKNLIKRAIAIIFGKKQPTNDPAAFQRMMSKIVAPADSTRYQALWQEYKNNKHYYVPTPHPFKDMDNKEKMYLWANSLSQFVSDKYSDAPIETLVHLVAGLTEIAAKEALKQSRSDLDEASQQKPRVRKYTKMRPDGSKAVRYEVLDHMGRRITGQGPEGFDDLKNAKDFYYKNYDRLSSLDETADGNVTDTVKMDVPLLIRIMEFSREDAKTDMELHDVVERLIELGKTGDTLTMQDYQDAVASVSAPETPDAPAEPVVKEAGGRYWCSTDKRWKDR